MLVINLSASLESKLMAVAQRHGKSPADMAAEALGYWLEVDEWAACRASSHQPNDETIRALEESLRGEGGKSYATTAELFAELDLEC